jgi:hypothetical protein
MLRGWQANGQTPARTIWGTRLQDASSCDLAPAMLSAEPGRERHGEDFLLGSAAITDAVLDGPTWGRLVQR